MPRLPGPAEKIAGGYVVKDAIEQALAFGKGMLGVYSQKSGAGGAVRGLEVHFYYADAPQEMCDLHHITGQASQQAPATRAARAPACNARGSQWLRSLQHHDEATSVALEQALKTFAKFSRHAIPIAIGKKMRKCSKPWQKSLWIWPMPARETQRSFAAECYRASIWMHRIKSPRAGVIRKQIDVALGL